MIVATWIMARVGGAGRVFLALLLAVFVLTPSFDFECAAEGLSPAAPSTIAASSTSVGEQPQPQPAQGGNHDAGLCPHGHCHHAAIASLETPVPAPSPLVRPTRPLWATTPVPASIASNRWERPPRA